MEQHHESPQQASAGTPARRRWRSPAIAASTALVAALCLHAGSTTHAAGSPAAAKVTGFTAQPAAQSTAQGGVHGAFNLYNGTGGGLEFWFDPSTGSLTVAVGTGTGALGGGVLGTYTYGTAPAAGTYLYADASLSAGTVVTVNLAGTYTLVNGIFKGSVSATVEGRTLTITSDGSSTFTATVTVAPQNAAEWVGPAVYQYSYYFSFWDIEQYIWEPIIGELPSPYSLVDDDATGTETTAYSDASGTDGSVVSGDGSSATSGDSGSSDDSGSSSDDGSGDSGGGGGGGSSDDGHAPVDAE